MIRYQGEDIEFGLRLKQITQNDMQTWNDARRIVAYFYTHTNHIGKFSSLIESGYNKMEKQSATVLTGVIRSADTKVMEGTLYCDIYIMPRVGDIEQERRVITGITIESTPIKQEAT